MASLPISISRFSISVKTSLSVSSISRISAFNSLFFFISIILCLHLYLHPYKRVQPYFYFFNKDLLAIKNNSICTFVPIYSLYIYLFMKTLPTKSNFLGIEEQNLCSYSDSRFVIQQLPYEHTSSYLRSEERRVGKECRS